MALQTPFMLGAVAGDAPVQYEAREVRAVIDALAYREGVCGIGHYTASQRAAGANASVDIAPGLCIVIGDTAAAQGKYVVRNVGVVNFTDIPAPPTSGGTRTHLLVLQVHDRQINITSDYTPVFAIKQDIGSGEPAAGPNEMPIAAITRRVGQTSVLTADIANRRTYAGTVPAVMAGFEFWGGNGQQINRRSVTTYRPFGIRYSVGCIIPDPTTASVTGLLPGAWSLSAAVRMNGQASADRHIDIRYVDPNQTFNRRIPGNGAVGGDGTIGFSCGGDILVRSGGSVSVTMWQDASTTTNLNDSLGELRFAGHYAGTIPGIY